MMSSPYRAGSCRREPLAVHYSPEGCATACGIVLRDANGERIFRSHFALTSCHTTATCPDCVARLRQWWFDRFGYEVVA